MFNGMTFDELNKLVKNPRAEPYETYFGDMELDEAEKKKRISLAERLEDEFAFALIFLFTMQQYNLVNWDKVRMRIDSGYRTAIMGFVELDDYMDEYIRQFSYDVIDSTQRNEAEAYYYSIDRAKFMAEEQSNSAMEHQNYATAIKSRKSKKKWLTMRDKRVRRTHREVDRKTIGINDLFLIGNSIFRYPRDEYFSPDPADVIGCRCTIKYF